MEMLWRKKDVERLTTYVRKFNTSITKLSRRFPELADTGLLPGRISARKIRESEISRRDFNRLMKKIDRWFKPKSREIITRDGIKMTRWEYQNALNNAQSVTYNRRQRRKSANRSERQKKQAGKDRKVSEKLSEIRERMHSDDYSEFTPDMARQSWINFTKQLEYQSTDEYFREQSLRYYDNYHTAIYENFSDGNDTFLANFIEDFRLSGDELFDLISEYPQLDIDYMYGPEEEEEKLMTIVTYLPRAVEKVLGKRKTEEGVERFIKREGKFKGYVYGMVDDFEEEHV